MFLDALYQTLKMNSNQNVKITIIDRELNYLVESTYIFEVEMKV